jgi:hypothetical protein
MGQLSMVRILALLISLFLFKHSFSSPPGTGSETLKLQSTTDSTSRSVRKGVFYIKGKQVDRQVYLEHLKCKDYRNRSIGSGILIGIGAAALAGSIPLFMRTNGFSGNGIYYGSGGIVLANLAAFGLGFGIPITISNVRFYKKSKCKEQTVYVIPQPTGIGFAYSF